MKQPIAVLLKDTHLKEDNQELVFDIFKQAVKLCQERKILRIFHAGDFFTARKAQPLQVLETADSIFRYIKDAFVSMTIIAGNHDKVSLTSSSSYIDLFRELACVIDEYGDMSFGDIDVHFLPYFKEDEGYLPKLLSIKSKLNFSKKNILITHIGVTGVRNNDGSQVENCLNKEIFNDFDRTFIAHYHDESWISDKIHYFPANYQANFGETVKKGFTILYDDLSTEFVESTFPKYIQIKLNINDHEGIKKAQQQYKNSSDNVRFVFEGEEAELKSVNKEKFAELGIDVTFNKDSAVPLEVDDLVKKASSVSFDRGNITEAFELFCQTKYIEDNSIGKNYLEKI